MTVHPDIRQAQTLDKAYYTDPQCLERMKREVFAGAWHYVGSCDEVARAGQVVPKVLGRGTLDEPVLLLRDQQGTLRVISNVCTHRGMLLLDTPCEKMRSLRCGYHGRRFELDGSLKAAPGFEGALNFPSPDDDLPSIALGQWGPLLFASLDPVVPFDEWVRPLVERLAFFSPTRMVAAPERGRTYEVEASWIAYCDNYLEGMHIPYVHAGLAGALDPGAYRIELFAQAILQVGGAAPGDGCFELPEGHPDGAEAVAAYYFALFPNTLVNLYPWGLSLNVVEPTAPDRCRVRFLSFVADPELLEQGAGADLHTVEMEDEWVVQQVARGLSARLYRGGRYAPLHEAGVHHFHRLISAKIAV